MSLPIHNLYKKTSMYSYPTLQEIKGNNFNGELKKLEYVGPVQKRFGSGLREFLNTFVKRLAGKCKLTDALINRIQNYFGVVLRSKLGSISLMKKAIWASI